MLLKKLISIALIALSALSLNAQCGNLNPSNSRTFYTPPPNRGIVINLRNFRSNGVRRANGNFDNQDDSPILRAAISEIQRRINNTNAQRGTIVIPGGNYRFLEINLISNLTLEIDRNATIRPTVTNNSADFNRNVTIFNITSRNVNGLRNVAIRGIGGGRFKINLRGSNRRQIFSFFCDHVNNFTIQNFLIDDNFTIFQAVGLGHRTINGRQFAPINGYVTNGRINNANYGYGLVQVQSGERLLFTNLSGSGGVTLRLETGFRVLNAIRPRSAIPRLNCVYGRNICCTNGQAAVHISPHTIDQGFIDVRNITAISCEWGIFIERGFERSFERGFGFGRFDPRSIIRDVRVTYGRNATTRNAHVRFVPCNVRGTVRVRNENGLDPEAFRTPSLAGVSYFGFTPNGQNRDNGDYNINIRASDVRTTIPGAFRNNTRTSEFPRLLTSQVSDYEDCSITPAGSFIPGPFQRRPAGIPNRTAPNGNLLITAGISRKDITEVDRLNSESIKLFPNPTTDYIVISNLEKNTSISIFNIDGKSIEYLDNLNSNDVTIHTSQYQKGMYIAKITSDTTEKVKNFVVE